MLTKDTMPQTYKRKRSWSRAVFSNLQRKGLEKRFEIQKYVTKPDRKQLAAMLGLTDAQVSPAARWSPAHAVNSTRGGTRRPPPRRLSPSAVKTQGLEFHEALRCSNSKPEERRVGVEMEEQDGENSSFLKMYVNKHWMFILAKRPKNRGERESATGDDNDAPDWSAPRCRRQFISEEIKTQCQ